MKKFQLLKWTAEVREVEFDEDGDVIDCEYLDIRYPEC